MKQYLLFFAFVSGCANVGVQEITLSEINNQRSGATVTVIGFLCKQVTVVYLSDRSNCVDFENARYTPMDLDKGDIETVNRLPNKMKIIVIGEVTSPPPGAIKFSSGLMLGTGITVESIVPVE